jgi:hypothetical protein
MRLGQLAKILSATIVYEQCFNSNIKVDYTDDYIIDIRVKINLQSVNAKRRLELPISSE